MCIKNFNFDLLSLVIDLYEWIIFNFLYNLNTRAYNIIDSIFKLFTCISKIFVVDQLLI